LGLLGNKGNAAADPPKSTQMLGQGVESWETYLQRAEEMEARERRAALERKAKELMAADEENAFRRAAEQARNEGLQELRRDEGRKAFLAHKKLFGAAIAAKLDAENRPTRQLFPLDLNLAGGKRILLFSASEAADVVRAHFARLGLTPSGIRRSSISVVELGRFVDRSQLLAVDPDPAELKSIVDREAESRAAQVAERARAHEAERKESERRDDERRYGAAVS
jgi:hypothetical protein